MFSLLVCWGGLRLTMPCVSASLNFSVSECSNSVLQTERDNLRMEYILC